MDLYFEPDKGMPPFWIEVGYFDTIKEIKEKVTRYQGIPVHQQTLKFNGKTLPDDLNILTSDIPDQSCIKLIINTTPTADHQPPPPPPPPPLTEPTPPFSCSYFSHKIRIFLKTFGVVMEMDMNDSISKLKEKINELQLGSIPSSRIVVSVNGIELHDHSTLYECQLVDGSEVEISLKPITLPTINLKPLMPPPTMTTVATTTTTRRVNLTGNHYSKKVKVNVVSRCGEFTAVLEMNPVSKVAELRKDLQKVRNQGVVFPLPEEGYFFIHKQAVMEEDQSFRWHGVEQGDIIDVFNGYITTR